jgi:DNA topoisomerase I
MLRKNTSDRRTKEFGRTRNDGENDVGLAKPEDISDHFLVIVESPSKIKKIEEFLGYNYRVIASMGHICGIEGLKQIDHKNEYSIRFSHISSKEKHIEDMRRIIEQYRKEQIILATDNDREGEAIGYHLCETFHLPLNTTRRIVFNEITESAIQYAIQHPTVLNMNIIRAQHARQILDMYIGFKISPVLWKYVYSSKSNALSAGRCQTPALRLIYDNYQERQHHHGGIQQYKTVGHFFPSFGIACELNHAFEQVQDVRKFMEESRTFVHECTIGEPYLSVRSPPTPLNTSQMLQTASHLLHIPPKGVMNLAQQLYQEGYITYMRTESKKYSPEFLQKVEKYITSLDICTTLSASLPDTESKGKRYVGNLSSLSNKGLGLPHEAIRVTDVYLSQLNTNDSTLNTLYHFIWKNTIESCMSAAEYQVRKIRISAPMKHEYIYSLEIPVFLGWKRLMNERKHQKDIMLDPHGLLLYLQSVKMAKYTYIESSMTLREIHSHYTESGLIQKLEDLEIGRPSTYAMFIETIQERGYVQKTDIAGITLNCTDFILRSGDDIQEKVVQKTVGGERGKLVIQPLGILCIEFLLEHFETLFDYSYTKSLEEELDKITTGNSSDGSWYQICEITRKNINEQVKIANQNHKQVYPIDETYAIVFQSSGPCVRRAMESSTIDYLPIKRSVSLQLEKIKKGEYTLEELLLYKQSYIGDYQEKAIHLRTGPYGIYIEWGDVRKSLGSLEEAEQQISWSTFSLETAIEYLEGVPNEPEKTGVLRTLTPEMSIRRGPYGNYIYYKSNTMKKPVFINTHGFTGNIFSCDAEELVSWAMVHKDTPRRGGRGGRGGRGRGRGGGRGSKSS